MQVQFEKNLSKLHEPFGECNLKEFSNDEQCKSIFVRAFIRLLIYYMTEKIANARALITTTVHIKN